MTVVTIILGVLLVLGGISCLCTPLATFLSTGFFFGIMLLVYGISGIVSFANKQSTGLQLVVSILAVLAGIISFIRPGSTLVFDSIVLYMIAAWLILQGVMSIVLSVRTRYSNGGWFWGVLVGALGIIAGFYSFAHPVLTAITAGMLIGFYFIQSGASMIVLGITLGKVQKELEKAAGKM